MATTFTDIEIAEFLPDECEPTDRGALQKLVLKLAPYPPLEWQNYFNAAWEQHLYMSKRRAWVYSDRLAIVAMPNELQNDHIPELKKVVRETNQAYRHHFEAQIRQQEAREHGEAARKKALQDLKGTLKLD